MKTTNLTTVTTYRRISGAIAIVLILSIWWTVPTYRKWRADKLVDELCAKDGGIKVYETVTLPSSMFNEYGQPKIKFAGHVATDSDTSGSGLYFSIESTDIIGDQNQSDISKLVVWKSRISLLRSSDGKVLGETICYSRRGGDAIGPWHPSSYSCPKSASEWDLAGKVVCK